MDTDDEDVTTSSPGTRKGAKAGLLMVMATNGGGWMGCPAVAPGVQQHGGYDNDHGMTVVHDGGGSEDHMTPAMMRGANGGGTTTMEMDMEPNYIGSNNRSKGTIKAYFNNMHSKGAKPTKFQGRKEITSL